MIELWIVKNGRYNACAVWRRVGPRPTYDSHQLRTNFRQLFRVINNEQQRADSLIYNNNNSRPTDRPSISLTDSFYVQLNTN